MHVPGHPKPCYSFSENDEHYLITKCHTNAYALRIHTEEALTEIKLPILELGILLIHETRNFDSVNAIIRKQDSSKHEWEYLANKFGNKTHLIDIQARHVFDGGLLRHQLKCAIGYNHHAQRERYFHKHIGIDCDVCGEVENWVHILLCPIARTMHRSFLKQLYEKMSKLQGIDNEKRAILRNIKDFLWGKTVIPGTQAIIGYHQLFRGIVVKNWFGINDYQLKFAIANKILVKECVRYYGVLWLKRNERRFSENVRRKRLLEWAEVEVVAVENFRSPVVSKFIATTYDQVREMTANAIKR